MINLTEGLSAETVNPDRYGRIERELRHVNQFERASRQATAMSDCDIEMHFLDALPHIEVREGLICFDDPGAREPVAARPARTA